MWRKYLKKYFKKIRKDSLAKAKRTDLFDNKNKVSFTYYINHEKEIKQEIQLSISLREAAIDKKALIF